MYFTSVVIVFSSFLYGLEQCDECVEEVWLCAIEVAGFEVGAHVLTLLMGRHLVAASYCVDAALGVLEGGYFADVVVVGGDYYELCDVLAGCDSLAGCAGVVETDFDGTPETLVNNAGAVAEYEVPFDSRAGTHKQHAYMAFWYGYVHAGVAYAVATYGDCQVVG